MKNRLRAAAFAAGALVCAALSAAVAGTSGPATGAGHGELRTVVMTAAPLDKGTVLGPREIAAGLVERRVPEDFAPPDALASPIEATERRLATSLPAGSYVSASDFSVGGSANRRSGGPPQGTTPVEIEVLGAGALAASRTGPGEPVDVVVSGDTAPGPQSGRTYVAAEGVPLLALREAKAEAGLEDGRWIATLALTRDQALRLIRAEGLAAQVRLLGR